MRPVQPQPLCPTMTSPVPRGPPGEARIVCPPNSGSEDATVSGVETAAPRPASSPKLNVAVVRRSFEARVRSAGALDQAGARRLLARLPPDRWTLEWYLPWWLGNAFWLDAATSREFVLGNLLGLASVRLQDDLADGETSDADPADVARLAAALYEAALVPYASRFGPESLFWEHLDRCMGTWRAAATDTSGAHRLADRGAPLKIAPFAACLLADRLATYATIESCLDHALEALVRYDHVADWRADLEAGRWNAFVADVSGGPQVPEARTLHEGAVLVAMLTSDVVTMQFATIRDGFLAAAGVAADLARTDDLPLPDLVDHLRRRAADAETQGTTFAARYRDLGDRAAKRLFTPPADGGS